MHVPTGRVRRAPAVRYRPPRWHGFGQPFLVLVGAASSAYDIHRDYDGDDNSGDSAVAASVASRSTSSSGSVGRAGWSGGTPSRSSRRRLCSAAGCRRVQTAASRPAGQRAPRWSRTRRAPRTGCGRLRRIQHTHPPTVCDTPDGDAHVRHTPRDTHTTRNTPRATDDNMLRPRTGRAVPCPTRMRNILGAAHAARHTTRRAPPAPDAAPRPARRTAPDTSLRRATSGSANQSATHAGTVRGRRSMIA